MIIFRYFAKEVYGTLLASTGLLLLLLISNQFVRYLTKAAAGVLPLHTVMQMMSLFIPLLLGILLPLGLYLGILIAYARLHSDGEMTVLSACGFSKAQLIGITLSFSWIVAIVVAVLMLWVQPKVEMLKRQIFMDAAATSPLERVSADQFINLAGKDLVFYAQGLSRDHHHLQNVFVAQHSENNTPTNKNPWNIIIAKEGHQMIDPQTRDRFLVLNQGERYVGTPGQGDFQRIKYDNYGVRIQKNVIPSENRIDTLSTRELWKQRRHHPAIHAELQWRIAFPLSAIILALLAIPLSKVNPRQGRYAQLIPAFLLYILYVDLLFVAKVWLKKGKISSGIGLWWVHLLMLFIALFLLCRYVGWERIFAKIARFKEKIL